MNSIAGYSGPVQEAVLEAETAGKLVESLKEMPEEDSLYFKNILHFPFSSDNILRASFDNPNSIYLNFCPLVLTPPPDSIG